MLFTFTKKISVLVSFSTIALLLCGLLVCQGNNALVSVSRFKSNESTTKDLPNLTGEKAINRLKETGEYESLSEALTAARYKIEGTSEGATANNHANNLRGNFTNKGLRLESSAKNEKWESQWRLESFGYGAEQKEVPEGNINVAGHRVELNRAESGVTEWFNNTPEGLEHGFTLAKRPSENLNSENLQLVISNEGNLQVKADGGGQMLSLVNEKGEAILSYDKLKVWDANGTELLAKMQTTNSKVVFEVAETNAVYPITIDPTFARQAILTASDDAPMDDEHFGKGVAIYGDTVIIGAYQDDNGSTPDVGSAYVFVRNGASWTEQQKLVPSDNRPTGEFGGSISIYGDTVIIGASFASSNLQGAAYIFTRNGTTWTEQQRIIAFDGRQLDGFGASVSLSGDTAVVGALQHDSGVSERGAAYIFVRSGASWTLQQKLFASDSASLDYFGVSVSISGETLIVGSFGDDASFTNQGSAYIFVRSGTIWTEQQKLTASDAAASDNFGVSVSISDNTIIIGAYFDDIGANGNQGSAYIFIKNGSTWTEQQKLTAVDGAVDEWFGDVVSISGNTIVIGARLSISSYVFTRNGTIWTQQQKLSPGANVAVFDDTVVVGSSGSSGSATIYRSLSGNFTQQILTASDGAAGDYFGNSVSLDGNTAVIGAYLDDVGANTDQGSAYVFVRSGGTWTFQQKLVSANGAAVDYFGGSVSISGNTIIVGSDRDNLGTNTNEGSAYIFVRSGSTWTQQQKLISGNGATGDRFGVRVSISGDTVVIGAYFDDIGANADQGSAYVFTRDGTTWTQEQKLFADDGAAEDYFGRSVAISGNTAIVGATADDVGSNTSQGSAYVFIRSGSTWTQQQKLLAGDGAAGDNFSGLSVSISGDTAIISAPGDDIGTNTDQGSAYIFVRNGTNWMQQAKLIAGDGAADDGFGFGVSISGDLVIVGAPYDDIGSNVDQGSAYYFTRSGTTWTQFSKRTLSNGTANDLYGFSVAVDGGTSMIGIPLYDNPSFAFASKNENKLAAGVDQGLSLILDNAPLAPTAASVTVGGRVLDNSGRGISRARVTLTDASGETRTALTSSFGYYRFDDVPAGQTYVFSVNHRRYQFSPQVLFVNEVIADFDFVALP